MSITHRKASAGTRALVFLCTLIVMATFGVFVHAGPGVSASAGGVARLPFTVDLGGFEAKGELTYPAHGKGPFPTVVLVHGSGPADMDFTMTDFDPMTGAPFVRSAIFADIASTLSEAGFAVARYNKRYVEGPGDTDIFAYIMNVTMQTLADDVRTVVEHVKSESVVDNDAIFLYGWSEGSVVAAHVAAGESNVAGLIVQAPVALDFRATFMYQIRDVGVEYLRQLAGDGPVTDGTLMAMLADADAGPAAKNIINYVADAAAFQAGRIAVSSLLDVDGNGELDIDGEIVPALDMLVDFALSPIGAFAIYGPGRPLPTLTEQADALRLPVLILQGSEDGHVPVDGARLLARALLDEVKADVTLHMYDGLGHSLGPAQTPIQDAFAPIAAEPMNDVVKWLEARAR